MNSKLTEMLVESAIQQKLISTEDREVYIYSVSSFVFCLVTWGTMLLMGILTQQIIGCLVFLVFYVPMRMFSGGFHQDKMWKCYIFSILEFAIVIGGAINPYMHIFFTLNLILLPFSAIAIVAIAPQSDNRKELSVAIMAKNKKRVHLILAAELILIVFSFFMFSQHITYYACVSINTVAILLIVGLIVQKRHVN